MKATPVIPVANVIVASGLALHAALAQQQGVKRTELQRYDLGEEIIYVLEGVWEYQVEGKGAMRLKAGEVLFIPAGVKHGAKNVGSGKQGSA